MGLQVNGKTATLGFVIVISLRKETGPLFCYQIPMSSLCWLLSVMDAPVEIYQILICKYHTFLAKPWLEDDRLEDCIIRKKSSSE